MKTRYYVLLIVAMSCLVVSSAQAEIYRYTNSSGDTVFTDRPMKGSGYRLVWRSGSGPFKPSSSSGIRVHSSGKKHHWKHKKFYSPMIRRVAKKAKLSPELLHAVIQAESSYNPKAKSSAGAAGLMQLMPGTASRYGVTNIWDPSQNLEGGARYLRDLLDMFKNNLRLALAAYNAGENAVKKYGNKIPPYPETQKYVRKVIDFYLSERKRRNS